MRLRWTLPLILLAVGAFVALKLYSDAAGPSGARAGANPADEAFPGLSRAVEVAAKRWNQLLPERPLEMGAAILPAESPRLVRYLELWLASRLRVPADAQAEAYPDAAFADPEAGSALSGQAFVRGRLAGRDVVVVFRKVAPGASDPQAVSGWSRALLCPLDVARRLGAALALTEDLLTAARRGESVSRFIRGDGVSWKGERPVRWRLVQQRDEKGEAAGLFDLEIELPPANRLRFDLWVETPAAEREALSLTLTRVGQSDAYDGWRVTGLRRVETPQPPAAAPR